MTKTGTMRAWLLALGLLLAGIGQAQAQCAGFTDVATGDGFCNNVQWLKNRAITLGCSSTTLYCPTDPVSRLAMAAFMNRLGTALTPTVLPLVSATNTLTLSSPVVTCSTGDYTVPAYPQRATVHASTDFYDATAALVVNTEVVYSLNGGGTWLAMPGGAGKSLVPATTDVTISMFGGLNLAPAQAVRFAIRSSRASGSGNPTLYCVNQVEIGNRNGASAPF